MSHAPHDTSTFADGGPWVAPLAVAAALTAALVAGQVAAAVAPRPPLARPDAVPVTETADALAADAAWTAEHGVYQ